ncbi:unnamed protein product [Miscanthus lutarioriparius]|uniref:non-specific serine/threonine protein kinase n=1 Tax=Miscanthus lutarioriparius TaxID=422564 RepID=A0A811RHD3_9POAL|nr:unnamed protein product [Miscanthus lutarioriparius]
MAHALLCLPLPSRRPEPGRKGESEQGSAAAAGNGRARGKSARKAIPKSMALWSGMGQVASIAQLAGVDAYGLISMIVEAAKTDDWGPSAAARKDTADAAHGGEEPSGAAGGDGTPMFSSHPVATVATYTASVWEGSRLIGFARCRMRSPSTSNFSPLSALSTTPVLGSSFWAELVLCAQGVLICHLFFYIIKESTDELHAAHHVEHDDRLRSEAINATKFENLGSHPPLKLDKDQTEGQVMKMGGLVNLIGGTKGVELSCFTFSHILAATDNFSEKKLVGNGGFGYVYKGNLTNGLHVAIKRLDASSFQGGYEFRTEIDTIPNLRIYLDETKRELINWSKRLEIIKAIADGLAFLHGHSQMCIVHRDIKASNVLLDHEMNAKITDFGLALMLAPNTTAEVTVVGTYTCMGMIILSIISGYADHEYVATGNISEKADVYGFGIVLFEIISGRLIQSYMKAEGARAQVQPKGAAQACLSIVVA